MLRCRCRNQKFVYINFRVTVFLFFCLLISTIINADDVVPPSIDIETVPESERTAVPNDDTPATNMLPAAVVWYLEKAENGDADAQYNLGNIYETGFGVEVNFEEAAKWYTEAAKLDYEKAELRLGILYILGKGVRESTIKGGKWIGAAAKHGNSVAQVLEEKVLSHSVEQDYDVKKLVNEVRLGLEKGETNAKETLLMALRKIERVRKEVPSNSRFAAGETGSGAKKGTVENRVPSFLEKQPSADVEIGNSIVTIRRHAKEGVVEAQHELAERYDLGNGVERSRKKALEWYTAAATQGYAPSQYRIGLAYLYGDGIEKDQAIATNWLKKAKNQKEPAASLLLEHISLANSGGLEKSITLSWNLERSLSGDGEAMLALGNMYENGWGVEQNPTEAKKWYIKARVAGTKGAAIQLRRMKTEGADEPTAPIVTATNVAVTNQTPQSTIASSPSKNNPVNNQSKSNALDENQSVLSIIKNKFFSDDSNPTWTSKLTANSAPLVLIIIGVIMGVLVFRWMRRNSDDSIF